MQELALEYGYIGLFVFSVVASTLVSAPADVIAITMPQYGYNPYIIVLVATVGGYIGKSH